MTGPGSNPRPADIAREARRVTMTGLLDRLTRRAKLTDAELLLLRAQWEIETTEAELAEKARRGLDRQRDQMTVRLQAADDTIREIEQDLDWARQQLLAAQQETTDAVTRAEKAEAEVELTVGVIQTLRRQLDDTEGRAEKAEAAIARVRALHGRWDCDANSCASCVDSYGTPVPYPCPTLRALDGTA